jgi:ABC-type multidrug transport system fused ATPase/permease subunit
LLSPRNLRAANATPRQRPCTIGVGSGSGDSGISTQARGEKLSPRKDSNRSAHDSTGSRVPPSSSWLHGWRPLEVLQHGSLCSSAILADVRGMVWLLDFSAADLPATSPLLDAASLVCEMLLEWQPVPLELSELRGASAHELCEQFQLSEAAAVRFAEVRMRYRPGLPLALDGADFAFTGGIKAAVVGRSGAGETSL